jgi:hypothetical protein
MGDAMKCLLIALLLTILSSGLAFLACEEQEVETRTPTPTATVAVSPKAMPTPAASPTVEATARPDATPIPTATLPPTPPAAGLTPAVTAAPAISQDQAIVLVRQSEEFSQQVSPYERELTWIAEYQGDDKWWILGVFESPWGAQFVGDATVWEGRVYAYTSYGMRPDPGWVTAKADQIGLRSLYTRLTPELAVDLVKRASSVAYAIRHHEELGWAGELRGDSSVGQEWWFLAYLEEPDGTRVVLAVHDAREGNYVSGYGFGESPQGDFEVPLFMTDWASQKAAEMGWVNITNLP